MIEVEMRRIGEAALDELIDYADSCKHGLIRGSDTPALAAPPLARQNPPPLAGSKSPTS